MNRTDLKTAAFTFILIVSATAVFGQTRFEGASLTVEAGRDGACPIRYQSNDSAGFSIDVFVAGTGQKTPATNVAGCNGSRTKANRVGANNFGQWCFQGNEPMYDVRLNDGTTYLWYPITKETGFYNVKDFRPVTRTEGPNPTYVFADPPDYTRTIKNAIAMIAARQGGTLIFPDGDYVVGTTDGYARDPKYEAITLPSGIVVKGASSNASIPNLSSQNRISSTRIRLRNENQTIFRIGGCTNQVQISDLELLGNTAFFGEGKRSSAGDYGIEAMGRWAINPVTHVDTPNASQGFKAENVTFQALNKGIYLHNAHDNKCDPKIELCDAWHFDYITIDHCFFHNNNCGIWIDTHNTDWRISNSFFAYVVAIAPGEGIHIERAGAVLIDTTFGGGYGYGDSIGGKFVSIGAVAAVTILNSESENGQHSIYTDPGWAHSAEMINVIGSLFGDKIELHGPLNYLSSGSFYLANTFSADPAVIVTSTGDRFCYSPRVLPGQCKDVAGKNASDPGFDKATVMFRTGHIGEGTGDNKLDARANFFGYGLEIGNGLMQLDPNVTFSDITKWATSTNEKPPVKDGAIVYCKDCKKNTTGICSQGQPGVDGAFAKRINGQWRCD